MPVATLDEAVVARFWAKVDKSGPNGCWEWCGSGVGNGYGRFVFPGGQAQAHRISYELLVGPIPEGLVLDHLCRVRHCVNPAHLEPVTDRENILRGEGPTAKNARKTSCPVGHPFEGDNLYINPQGFRLCRTCQQRRKRRLASVADVRVRRRTSRYSGVCQHRGTRSWWARVPADNADGRRALGYGYPTEGAAVSDILAHFQVPLW